jgi:DNA-binding NarL/FixJ family response regulator
VAREWPLVGRGEELLFIAAAMRRASGTSGLVLAGAAGVGKTRLAREALTLASGRGASVRWAHGSESARAIPLGAFSGLLGDLDEDPARLIPRAIDTLSAASGTPRVVIGVDDAHLLDDLSATLVHQLVVRGAATVVLTLRTSEPAPDAVTALWKDEHLERVEIQPLSESETSALLDAVLDGPVDSGGAARLWRLTGGNALLLRHLVEGELEAGRLSRVGGVWRWSQQPAISAQLAEIVKAQIGRMPETLQDVVDVLALAEPLGTPLLAAITDAAAVEDAERRGVLRIDVDRRRLQARLAHPLYGEVRRGEMGLLRARRLRGVIATALAGTGARRADDTVRRAVLALGSDLEPDISLFLASAHSAIRLFDLSLAERLARAAADAGGGFAAKLILTYALSWGSRCEEAERILAELVPLARDDFERAQVGGVRAGNLFWPLGRAMQAEEVLDATLASVHDADMHALLTAMRAAFDTSLGRPKQGLDTGRRILAHPTLDDQGVVLAAIAVVGAAMGLGRLDEARRVADLGYQAAARSFNAGVIRFGLSDLHILAMRLSGHIQEAERVAQHRLAETEDIPGPPQLMALVLSGQADLAAGRLRTAVRRLREARAGLMSLETHEFLCRCQVHLTQALGMTGEVAEAGRMLAELERRWHPAYTVMEPDRLLARAWVCAAEGASTEAIAAAHEAAELARGRDQPAYEVVALQAAACFGDRGVADRLAMLATVVDGPRAPTAAAHAAALAADDGDALLSASAQWERIGDLLTAADAAAHAAIAYMRGGKRGSAAVAAAKADRLAKACEGARTPALAAAARPLPLSDREREIATLAARGLSNREIADRLVVSVRTVEGHLYRVGNKLGISDRRQLATVLGEDPPHFE